MASSRVDAMPSHRACAAAQTRASQVIRGPTSLCEWAYLEQAKFGWSGHRGAREEKAAEKVRFANGADRKSRIATYSQQRMLCSVHVDLQSVQVERSSSI
jgi:hypothetical protein